MHTYIYIYTHIHIYLSIYFYIKYIYVLYMSPACKEREVISRSHICKYKYIFIYI